MKLLDWVFGSEPKPETKLQVLRRHEVESAELGKHCTSEMRSLIAKGPSEYVKTQLSDRQIALFVEMNRAHKAELDRFETVTVNVEVSASVAERKPATGGLASTIRHIVGE